MTDVYRKPVCPDCEEKRKIISKQLGEIAHLEAKNRQSWQRERDAEARMKERLMKESNERMEQSIEMVKEANKKVWCATFLSVVFCVLVGLAVGLVTSFQVKHGLQAKDACKPGLVRNRLPESQVLCVGGEGEIWVETVRE